MYIKTHIIILSLNILITPKYKLIDSIIFSKSISSLNAFVHITTST